MLGKVSLSALFASRRLNKPLERTSPPADFGLRISGSAGLLGAEYGVPALAGSALSLGGGSKHLEIHGETPSHRLKPGIHTLRLFSFIRDAEYQKLAAWDKNVLPALTRPRSGQECPRSPPPTTRECASSRNDYTACPPATGAAIITYRILNKKALLCCTPAARPLTPVMCFR